MKSVRVGELEMRQGTRSSEKGCEECNRGTHCVVSKDCGIFTINKRRNSRPAVELVKSSELKGNCRCMKFSQRIYL